MAEMDIRLVKPGYLPTSLSSPKCCSGGADACSVGALGANGQRRRTKGGKKVEQTRQVLLMQRIIFSIAKCNRPDQMIVKKKKSLGCTDAKKRLIDCLSFYK